MANAGASIEALLTLDNSGFNKGITSSIEAVEKFSSVINGLSVTGFNKGIAESITNLSKLIGEVNKLNGSISNIKNFDKLSLSIQRISRSLVTLSSDSLNAEKGINIITAILEQWNNTLNGTEIKIKGVVNSVRSLTNAENQNASATERVKAVFTGLSTAINPAKMSLIDYGKIERETYLEGKRQEENLRILQREFKALALGVEQFNAIETGTVAKQREVANATNQVTNSMERQSVASNRATTSTTRQASATRGLGKALSSLRMMGGLVASMFAYNFAHKLLVATGETVHAKSEMEGYFKMLHFSQGQIDRFNTKLDETVGQFQRINKYSLGETISSIGVEFELTTKEMEKAMPVVSMITSEYLRAGRNANEASLAVKDILQGEFQRLSRETGVKGKQLKDAGWSGDKNDVMGLLDALKKVGESRNWDTFVVKANSLNDIITIVQNRFGEWSADMVNTVQPTIVGAFNGILDVGNLLGSKLSGLWKSLNSNSILASAVKIGAVSTALIHGLKYLTMYRSGANLLQASTMGLRKALTSLIFGINLETTATKKNYEAILMKILGLKAEDVAEGNLVKTINASILRKGMETTEENANTVAKGLNAGATSTQTTTNIGFLAGLQAVITGKALDTEATLTLSGAMGILTATMLASPFTWFIAGLTAVAGAVFVLTGGLDEHWSKMQEFNNILENSDDIVKQHKDYLNQLADTVGKDSQQYKDAQESVNQFNDSLKASKKIVKEYETEVNNVDVNLDMSIKSNLKSEGFSDKDISDLSKRLDSMNEGFDTYYRALQVIHKQEDTFKQDNRDVIKSMGERNAKADEVNDKTAQMKEHWDNFIKHSAEHNTSEDWWGGTWSGILAGFDGMQVWLDVKTEELADWWHDFNETYNDLIPDFSKAFDNLKFPDWDKKWNDWVNDVSNSLGDSWEYITGAWDNNIVKPLTDWWNGFISFDWLFTSVSASDGSTDHPSFMEDLSNIFGFDVQAWINSFNSDPLGTLGISIPSLDIVGLFKSLFPSDINIGEWLNNVFDINGFVSKFTINLGNIIPSVQSTVSSVVSSFSGMFNGVRGFVGNIVNSATTGFKQVYTNSIGSITNLRDGVSNAIHKVIDAFGRMKTSILDSAKKIYDGVKEKFDSVKNTIGGFYHKLTNPSEWFSGAGLQSYSRSPKPNTARKLFSPVKRTGVHGAGVNPYQSSDKKVTLDELVSKLGGSKKVNLNDFLSLFADSGFGGWNFAKKHKTTIFNEGKKWNAKSPSLNGVTLGDGFPVKRFWKGEAKGFTWDEFMSVASAIFTAIPYKFYMDSDWKGDWVSALTSGATNCYDGSMALLSLAKLFGFEGNLVHTNLKSGMGHFFVNIGGRKLDTTNFQHHGSWKPLGGAGIPTRSGNTGYNGYKHEKTVNVTVDMSNSTIYGVDDLDERIADGVDKGLQSHFNDPYTVAI